MTWLRAFGRWIQSIPRWLWAGLIGVVSVGAAFLAGRAQGQKQERLEDRARDAEAVVERSRRLRLVEASAEDEAEEAIAEVVAEAREALKKQPTWEEIDELEREADTWPDD